MTVTNLSHLSRKIVASLMCVASLVAPYPLLSDDPSRWLSSAVDAQGIRHHGSDYGRKRAPWMDDAIKAVAPRYPYEARARHQFGSGLVRVTLDLSTGLVAKVTMIKSTGLPVLDNSAADAFRQWRWKPGKWKEVDLPITFTMVSSPPRLPPGAKTLPPQR
jgi:TonB family protein